MSEPNAPLSKEELIKQIQLLEASVDLNKSKIEPMAEELKKFEAYYKEMTKVLESIRDQYGVAKENFYEKEIESRKLKEDINKETEEMLRLKRELKRRQDQDLLNAQYAAQLEEFRKSCLDAPWRKENRTDGIGALPHQIEGAIELAVAKRGLLADKRGLGKTLTSIIWLDFIEATKVIAISPSDTMDNYIREIKLWAPHRNVIKLGKMSKGERDFLLPVLKNSPEFILVLNFEAWRRDDKLIQDLVALQADTLIIDEAHHGKTDGTTTAGGIKRIGLQPNKCPNCGSDQVRQVKEIGRCDICKYEDDPWHFSTVKNVLPMTGTPILNKPQELFPQLRLIRPSEFRYQNDYLRDYCRKNYNNHWVWQYGGEKDVVKKIGHRYVARDRKSAGIIIPPSKPQLHLINKDEMKEYYPQQFRAYEQVRKYAQLVLDEQEKIAMSMPIFLSVLTRLRQVLAWPNAIELKKTDPNTGFEETVAKLDVRESIKLDKAEELIKEFIEEGERVVLFSQFKAPLEILQQRLGIRVAIYNGDTPDYLRQQIQLDFDPKTTSDKPAYDAVLCNYRAAGEGLNFNSASQMIILDEEWNPGRQEQAYGRIDRLGQTKETTIHTIRVEKSVDDWMAGLIEEKREMITGFEQTQESLAKKFLDGIADGDI